MAIGAAQRLNILDNTILITLLRDPETVIRRRAIDVAAATPPAESKIERGPDLAAELVVLLGDAACAEPAAFALGELGLATDEIVERLSDQALGHDDPLCRESAVAALGALQAGLAAILEATADVATVRRRAIIALASFEGPEVDAALAKGLQDRDWQVRQAAEDLLELD